MTSLNFDALPLHDAVLERIELCWEQKLCRLHLCAFLNPRRNAISHLLEFQGVTGFSLSAEEPWGPSVCVLGARQTPNGYQIDMQSGDSIRLQAPGFSFHAI